MPPTFRRRGVGGPQFHLSSLPHKRGSPPSPIPFLRRWGCWSRAKPQTFWSLGFQFLKGFLNLILLALHLLSETCLNRWICGPRVGWYLKGRQKANQTSFWGGPIIDEYATMPILSRSGGLSQQKGFVTPRCLAPRQFRVFSHLWCFWQSGFAELPWRKW